MKLYVNKLRGMIGKENVAYMEYAHTNREAKCRFCHKIIPKGVNRLRTTDYSVSWKDLSPVCCVRSYCHTCMVDCLDGYFRQIKHFQKMRRQVLNRVKKEDMKEIEHKYKERELLERI
jgi:hypothetical protein